jgi:hypothetical protein
MSAYATGSQKSVIAVIHCWRHSRTHFFGPPSSPAYALLAMGLMQSGEGLGFPTWISWRSSAFVASAADKGDRLR